MTIAIARDEAFSFLYPANLEVLSDLGARSIFFSQLADESLPEADAVYLPGGYPELHLDTLAASGATKVPMQAHIAAGRPVYAECGGMLYLLDSLTDRVGKRAAMLGLLPGDAKLQKRLRGIGLQAVGLDGGTLRGHTFHYSLLDTHSLRVSMPVAHMAVHWAKRSIATAASWQPICIVTFHPTPRPSQSCFAQTQLIERFQEPYFRIAPSVGITLSSDAQQYSMSLRSLSQTTRATWLSALQAEADT
ncbi:hypothetical protein AWV80_33345 [Cupriavidus sp. UYMU48A]|nr:hypothetical protein AWV80_33345 [Cupriavidus sp. UYMU48A]